MTLNLIEFIQILFGVYLIFLVSSIHINLIAQQVLIKRKNFLISWLIIFSCIAIELVILAIFYGYGPINLEMGFVFLLVPQIISGLYIFFWRYHGPVIVITNNVPIIHQCKFLFSFSEHYDINFRLFHFIYQGKKLISNEYDKLSIHMQLNYSTTEALYLLFIKRYRTLEAKCPTEYYGSFRTYLRERVQNILHEAIDNKISSLAIENLETGNQFREIIRSEFADHMKNTYQIETEIDWIIVDGIKAKHSILPHKILNKI